MTHYRRIRRHDHLVEILAKSAKMKSWTVTVEPRYRGTDGRLRKPDLSFSRNTNVIIADVAVSWDRPEPLTDAYQNKVTIYSDPPFINTVQRVHPGCTISVHAHFVGARDTWCSLTDGLLGVLGVDRGLGSSFVCAALRGGIHTHFAFGRPVW